MRERIAKGELAPESRLPSHLELAQDHHVSPVTARHAVRRLEQEGLVRCIQGRGTFVCQPGNGSVLVVDPDDVARALLHAHLSHPGYRVVEVSDGKQALTALQADKSIALIISAVHIPTREAGLDFFRAAHQRRPHVPTACATAYLSDLNELHGTPACPLLIAAKPIQSHQVEAILRLALRRPGRRGEFKERFRASFDGAAIGMAIVGLDDRYLEVNQRLCDMVGYTREELLTKTFQDVTHAEDLASDLEYGRRIRAGEITTSSREKRYIRKDGSVLWIALSVSMVRDSSDQPSYFIATMQDVTERKRVEEARMRLAAVVEASDDAIVSATMDGTIRFWNRGAERLYGYTEEEVVGGRVSILIPDDRRAELPWILEQLAQGTSVDHFETVRLDKNGRGIDVSLTISPIIDATGQVIGSSSIARDISERKAFEAQLQHQALHDPLTDLPNRTLFNDRLQQAVAAAHRSRVPFAVLLLDLDHFKEINDLFGHDHGDVLLGQLKPRLQEALRSPDTIARLGGDEFGVLLPATDAAGARRVSEKLLAAIAVPFVLDQQTLDVGASIGIVLYPDHGEDAPTLLKRADIAMYVAKRGKTGFAVYAPTADRYSGNRLALMGELRKAVEASQLYLHYQPKVDLATGKACGVEAFARWHHPDHGVVPPDKFIPLAEETGLIQPLTLWVLTTALCQSRVWALDGLDVPVAVNISPRVLHDLQIVDTIRTLLRNSEAPASSLTMEITEHAVMADPERAITVLQKLRALGVKVSVDDFGTDYSSLASLQRLPIDEVKIDRSFVRAMDTQGEDERIVLSLIRLAHDLGFTVVAEGIETQAAQDALEGMGCDVGQGYHLCRPVAPGDLSRWLAEHQPCSAA